MELQTFLKWIQQKPRTYVVTCAPTSDVLQPNICSIQFESHSMGFEMLLITDGDNFDVAEQHARIVHITRAIGLPEDGDVMLYLVVSWRDASPPPRQLLMGPPIAINRSGSQGTKLLGRNLLPFAYWSSDDHTWYADIDLTDFLKGIESI